VYGIKEVAAIQKRFQEEIFAKYSYAPIPTAPEPTTPKNDEKIIMEIINFWFVKEDNDRHKYSPKES